MPQSLTRYALAIRNWAMNRPTYWSIRKALQYVSFRIASVRYRASTKVAELGRISTIAALLIKSTATIAITAFAAALLLQFLDNPLNLSGWINAFSRNPAAYDAFLQATAGINGVLLALSFAAISTLASALFVQVPSDLQSLLLDEEVTKVSIQALGFTTVFSLTALGLRSVGLPQSRFVSLALLLTLPFAIVSMTLVARRVLALFDPSILSLVLFRRLSHSAAAMQAGHHRANDPGFQDHHRRQATDALDALATMFAFAQRQEGLRGESLLKLARQALHFLPEYLETKRSIPTDSRWFAHKPRYPEWYRASSTQLDLATMTESSLSPELQKDHHWIEHRLLSLSRSAYETMLKNTTTDKPQRFLMVANQTLGVLGAEWDLDVAKDYAESLIATTAASLATFRSGPTDVMPLEALADTMTNLAASAFLGFVNSLKAIDAPGLGGQVRALHWPTETGIYALRTRLAIRRELEGIRRTVLFERVAEGRPATPGHVHAKLILEELATTIQASLTLAIDWFKGGAPNTARALKKTNARLGAIAYINALALRWKIEQNLMRLRPLEEALRQFQNDAGTPAWPWDSWENALVESRTTLELELANTLPGLATQRGSPDRPDLLGEAVHRLGEGCFSALTNSRALPFTELFPHYFKGVLLVIHQLREQTPSTEEFGFRVQDAFLDVITLSGYARVWSALYRDRRYWVACRDEWNNYVRDATAPGRCEALALMVRNRHARLAPRSSHRMKWRMTLERALRALPQEERRVTGGAIPDTFPRHRSVLIRFLGRNGADRGYDGADIFRDAYLRREPACRSVAFHRDSIVTSLKHFARLRYS